MLLQNILSDNNLKDAFMKGEIFTSSSRYSPQQTTTRDGRMTAGSNMTSNPVLYWKPI